MLPGPVAGTTIALPAAARKLRPANVTLPFPGQNASVIEQTDDHPSEATDDARPVRACHDGAPGAGPSVPPARHADQGC